MKHTQLFFALIVGALILITFANSTTRNDETADGSRALYLSQALADAINSTEGLVTLHEYISLTKKDFPILCHLGNVIRRVERAPCCLWDLFRRACRRLCQR